MNDELRQAALRLREAIRNEGPHPDWHRKMMARHRREWPTLWVAIVDVLAAVELEERGEAK